MGLRVEMDVRILLCVCCHDFEIIELVRIWGHSFCRVVVRLRGRFFWVFSGR
jgi:hypothetical protein